MKILLGILLLLFIGWIVLRVAREELREHRAKTDRERHKW